MPSDDHGKIKKSRQRASIACHGCRERRTRCVMLAGSATCMHCCETGQECIVKQDDRRRKPVSKAYVYGLQRRIQELETALGGGSPPEQHQAAQEIPSAHMDSIPSPTIRPSRQSPNMIPAHRDRSVEQQKPIMEDTCPTGDELRGDGLGDPRQRGPTAGHHIKWHQWVKATPDEEADQVEEKREGRPQRVIAAMSPDTQEYLMGLFWQHYNAIIHVIHRDAFEEGQKSGDRSYYSCFLHICMLAVGYRYADKEHPNIARIAHASRERTLHREAKDMVSYEIEHPGGIPSIAGLLLLADLEGGCGRDNVGWLYVGVAIRLCFNIGLDRKPAHAQIAPQEIEIRRTTLRACVLYDRYWSLFLGRPLALKLDNLEAYHVSKTIDQLRSRPLPKDDQCWETQIYDALLQLMELAGHIADILETMASDKCQLPHQQYFQLAALDHELSAWYSQLPSTLQYTTDNVRTAPLSFFHLHQQYYSVMIMLHSELGKGDTDSASPTGSTGYHLALLSQVTCTTCAGRMAQIFSQQRQRFHINQMFSTGLQHAGSAASVLVTALASSKKDKAWTTNKKYLECIFAVLEEMSTAYEAAERMVPVLNSIMRELTGTERHSSRSIRSGQEKTEDADGHFKTNMPSHGLFDVDCSHNHMGSGRSLTPSIAESLSFDIYSPSSLPSLWGGPDTASFSHASDFNLPNFDMDLPTPPMMMGEKSDNAGLLALLSETQPRKAGEEHSLPSYYEPWTGDPPTMVQRDISGNSDISRGPMSNPKSHIDPIAQDSESPSMAHGVWPDPFH